uniref:Uncharacterized protein n=1 Tax=Populus trichocarpa TaxID=3694 RepID=A0A2K1XH38_POPTR
MIITNPSKSLKHTSINMEEPNTLLFQQQPKHIPFEFTSAWHHASSGCSRLEGKKKYQSKCKLTFQASRIPAFSSR